MIGWNSSPLVVTVPTDTKLLKWYKLAINHEVSMKRKIMSPRANKKNFKRGAKTHPKNSARSVSRGGIRL